MAAVYKAYQPGMERHVALKILPRHLAGDPEFQGRFEQEAKVIAQLQHVHILPVHDFGEDQGYTYIVMPLIQTGTLADLMLGEPLSLERIREVIGQVGGALDYAHKRGLVHRDIKPSNILIDDAGNCLLTDFGIAKMVEETVKFTQTGAIIGTPAYMSPEQIKGEKLDGRSDLYSLGVVLFEMATGRPPYQAETPPAIFVKHLHDPLPLPTSLNPELPESLELVILKCLSKSREDRYSSASEMVQALNAATTERSPEPSPPEPSRPEPSPALEATAIPERPVRAKATRRKIPVWAWLLGAAVLLGGISSALILGDMLAVSPTTPSTVQHSPTARAPSPAESTQVEEIQPVAFVCLDPIGCVDIAPDEPIHIAYMLTLSGATAVLGEDSLGGIEIAIVDRGGRLLDHPITLTGEDSGCSSEGGQTAATRIASDSTIVGVVGTNCSSAMTSAMEILTGSGLTILSPSNTAPALTLESGTWQPGYFRVAHTDLLQGAMAAEFIYHELGARTVATIHDGSPYTDQLQQVMSDRFRELGGEITFQGAVNVGDTDMRAILTSAAAGAPEVLYFPIFESEGPFIVQQTAEIAGLENTILMGADGLLVSTFPENAGRQAEGMYLSGPFVAGERYHDFLTKWDARYGGSPPSGFHAFAYDAADILLNAIEAVAIQERDGTLHIGRQALRDAVKATSGYQGLTGTLSCADKDFGAVGISKGDCATGEALAIYQLTDAEVREDRWPPQVVWVPGD